MEETDRCSIYFCDEVAGHQFIRTLTAGDFGQSSFHRLGAIKNQYEHVLGCPHCFSSVGSALMDYAVGNDLFPTEDFHRNLAYLEDEKNNKSKYASNKI